MNRPLSKSQFVRGLQCGKSLWLYRNKRDVSDDLGAYDQKIMEQGTEFGRLARERFGGGVLIEADYLHAEDALNETQRAMQAGATTLYEAAFLFDDVLVRVDILTKIKDRWTLYEVKSSTDAKDEHLDDVAVQVYVLRGSGINVDRALLVHANPEYVRKGELDLGQLFGLVDLTEEVNLALSRVGADLSIMKAEVSATEEPKREIGAHCAKPYDCDFRGYCWAKVPKYSVFNLAYAKMPQKLELYNAGILHVRDVPAGTKLPAQASAQVQVAKSGRQAIDHKAVKGFLSNLQWPRYFLDFETDNPVVPPYDWLSPYTQMPFQASVRWQETPTSEFYHAEFVGDGLNDPRRDLSEFLIENLGRSGSIVAYHKSFEGGRLEELALLAYAYGKTAEQSALSSFAKRLWDLADAFRTGAWVDPRFEGKWSIKNVLPVLVPDLSYKDLAIKNGVEAMLAYARMRDHRMETDERAKTIHDLKVYCGLDTEAMVRILDVVEKTVVGAVAA